MGEIMRQPILHVFRYGIWAVLVLFAGCASVCRDGRREAVGPPANVLCGIDVLERDQFKALAGRHIAIITNQSGLDRQGNRTIDLLAHAGNCQVVCLFSPEHGLYGNVDAKVDNTVEPKTGLKVWSLYGKTTRPSPEMLQGVDTLVYDIQDVGARFYTVSVTLGICMEEAAKHHLQFVVLDRPNPITGVMVDGPIADKEHFGFTAYGPMPVTHGLTSGELARLYNDAWGVHCDLRVIPMQGWKRKMWFDETGLTWINTSPNMRNLTQALLYPAVCLLEATNVSVGRGTDQPFEFFGAPWIDGQKLSGALNAARLPGLRFIPIEFTPTESRWKGKQCQGVYILVTNRDRYESALSGITIVYTLRNLFGDKFAFDKVEHLLQNKQAIVALRNGQTPAQVQAGWQADLAKFRDLRRKYFLYPE
jgi:uncharacterized protein YbbC (DUF1343 family)